jgi:hypothetical protein
VEAQEKAAQDSLKPQTVTQVDQLLQKLQAAIDDLKTQRVQLEQKEKEEQQQKAKDKKK